MSIATLWNYSTSSLSRRIIAAMLALTLSACSDDFEPTGEPISGSVQNYFTGQNLPNATIVATRNDNGSSVELGRTVTDSEGEYTIFVLSLLHIVRSRRTGTGSSRCRLSQ